jgi:hypothetical protein
MTKMEATAPIQGKEPRDHVGDVTIEQGKEGERKPPLRKATPALFIHPFPPLFSGGILTGMKANPGRFFRGSIASQKFVFIMFLFLFLFLKQRRREFYGFNQGTIWGMDGWRDGWMDGWGGESHLME